MQKYRFVEGVDEAWMEYADKEGVRAYEAEAPIGSKYGQDLYAASEVDARMETLECALNKIVQWAKAYPLDVFPEPDFAKVREALQAAGLSLDQVSASNMRHVIEQAGGIARAALGEY